MFYLYLYYLSIYGESIHINKVVNGIFLVADQSYICCVIPSHTSVSAELVNNQS